MNAAPLARILIVDDEAANMLACWGQRLVADNDVPAHVDRVLAKPPKLRELREALARLCQSTTTEPTP